MQFIGRGGQVPAPCVQPNSLSSLFTSFSAICCRCALYCQARCIHSRYPDKRVSRFGRASLFLLCPSPARRACVFLSTQKHGLLGFTASYRAGFQSPFRFCLFLDLECNGNVRSALNAWLVLAKKFLLEAFISHDYPQTNTCFAVLIP